MPAATAMGASTVVVLRPNGLAVVQHAVTRDDEIVAALCGWKLSFTCFPGASPLVLARKSASSAQKIFLFINTLLGGARGSRTPDLLNAIHLGQLQFQCVIDDFIYQPYKYVSINQEDRRRDFRSFRR